MAATLVFSRFVFSFCPSEQAWREEEVPSHLPLSPKVSSPAMGTGAMAASPSRISAHNPGDTTPQRNSAIGHPSLEAPIRAKHGPTDRSRHEWRCRGTLHARRSRAPPRNTDNRPSALSSKTREGVLSWSWLELKVA